jgi:hypothetical protein
MTTATEARPLGDAPGALDDDLICTYWSTIIADPARRRPHICGTLGASAELILATLDDTDAVDRCDTERRAATNPGTPQDLLLHWARHSDIPSLQIGVLTNPALGAAISDLYPHLNRNARMAAVTNPGVDPDWLIERLSHHRHALANPACPDEIVLAHLGDHPGAWSHPAVGADELRGHVPGSAVRPAADDGQNPLEGTAHLRRLAAIHNPNCPLDAIRTLDARLHINRRARTLTNEGAATLAATSGVLDRHAWRTAPHHQSAGSLLNRPAHPAVAATFAALDDTERSAVATLIDRGFDGTVAELVAVATAVAQ